MPKGFWWLIEIGAFVGLLCMAAVILPVYSSLPSTIPTHFGLSGKPDGLGGKSTLLFLLTIASLLFALTSAMPFFPGLINVPGPRTPAAINAAIAITRVVKLELMVFFACMSWAIIETALGHADGIGAIPLCFVAALLTTVAIGIFASSRNAT